MVFRALCFSFFVFLRGFRIICFLWLFMNGCTTLPLPLVYVFWWSQWATCWTLWICFHMEQVSSYLISKNVYEVHSPLLFLEKLVQIFARQLFQDSRDSLWNFPRKHTTLKLYWVIVKIKIKVLISCLIHINSLLIEVILYLAPWQREFFFKWEDLSISLHGFIINEWTVSIIDQKMYMTVLGILQVHR